MEGSRSSSSSGNKICKQPYKKFLDITDSLGDYWWDEERLTILPVIDGKPEELIQLPPCECDLALRYVPAAKMTDPNQATAPAPDIQVCLHSLYEESEPKMKNPPKMDTKTISFEPQFMAKLQEYAPLIDSSGTVRNSKAHTLRHARSEVLKHLKHIPFLNGDGIRYWGFAVAAFEKYKLANIMDFIIQEGKKKKWVGDAEGRPGWSILPFKGLVQLAHMYPPIRDSGAKYSFKVVQLPSGYYLREMLLALTRDMKPAERSRALLIYQDATGKVAKKEEYLKLMDFSANLLFKNVEGNVKIVFDD